MGARTAPESRGSHRSLLGSAFLALLLGLLPRLALAFPEHPRCLAIEQPRPDGRPVIFLTPGVVPVIGPLEAADLVRNGGSLMRAGYGPARVVTCVEYVPAPGNAGPGSSPGPAHWVVHVEASFWTQAPFSTGGCRSQHGLVEIADVRGSGGGGVWLLDPRSCTKGHSRLTTKH